MAASQRSWVEQDQASALHRNDAQTIQRVTLTKNQDFSAVLDISAARTLYFDSLKTISSDTVKLYLVSANTAAVRGFPGGAFATGSITYAAPDTNDTVVVNGTSLKKVAAAPGANEFTTITELEVLADAVANINSDEDGTTVSLAWDTGGTAGNAATLALGGGNTGTMAVSGATLTGGAATDEWGDEYKNNVGTNPFAAANSQIVGFSAVGLTGLLVLRDGEADGDIEFIVGVSNF